MPEEATQVDVEEMRVHLGLDKPIHIQFLIFLKNALKGDLGKSFYHRQPALKLMVERLPASLLLMLCALAIALIIGIPMGIVAAVNRGNIIDRICLVTSLAGLSAPGFWIGILCILVFAVEMGWLPTAGYGTWKHLILPSFALGFRRLGLFVRLIRGGMLEVLSQDYVRTARAKGLAERMVLYKHALKNTLIPFVTIVGLQMGHLLAGAVVTEKIFAWPGTGRMFLIAIDGLDYPVVLAYAIVVGVFFVVINFIVDVVYTFLDPRIRYGGEE
jgi:peptide/nickel transport system permease protein